VVVEHEAPLRKLFAGLDLTIHRDEAEGCYLNAAFRKTGGVRVGPGFPTTRRRAGWTSY